MEEPFGRYVLWTIYRLTTCIILKKRAYLGSWLTVICGVSSAVGFVASCSGAAEFVSGTGGVSTGAEAWLSLEDCGVDGVVVVGAVTFSNPGTEASYRFLKQKTRWFMNDFTCNKYNCISYVNFGN